jgi:SH3-like domain-containing protein
MHRSLILISLLFFSLSTNGLAEIMSVAFTGTEVRSAPSSMSSEVVLKANKYYPLTVSKQGPEYYKVSDYRGRNGFVHKSLLKPQPAIVVTGDRANVRQGPSTNDSVIFQLSKGESGQVTGEEGKWIEIKTADGRRGWIAGFLTWGSN